MRPTRWTFLPILVTLTVFACPARAQYDDLSGRLRAFLSLPSAAIVKVSYGTPLPKNRPLRVSIATDPEPRTAGKLQITARAEVERFIAEYNKHNGKTTQLEVVETIEQADVVLVHFEDVEKRRLEQSIRDTSDPRSTMDTRAGGGSFDAVYRSEIRGYLLIREGDVYTVVDDYRLSVVLGGRRLELRRLFERALRSKQR